ncbi:MAG: DUF1819 family protein [Pyrinomonadaceae bacterium]|nr:DUF1819 family protein [Pyrinomonadaceae bacterium]
MAEVNSLYTSRIIKASALLADTKTLLANWNDDLSIPENLSLFRQENIFGKASRSRVEDILTIFRQRYLVIPSVIRALVILVKSRFSSESLDRLLYFHAAQSDRLLHDTVTEVLSSFQIQGRSEIRVEDLQSALSLWVREGKTAGRWSEPTILRIAQGLLSTLRDFRVLQGAVNKRLAPIYLPIEAFAYIAFYLRQSQPSGERLIQDPEWRLFFLFPQTVEKLFMEAHQRRLLEYHAAGSIIRIAFPAKSLEEYASVISERSH